MLPSGCQIFRLIQHLGEQKTDTTSKAITQVRWRVKWREMWKESIYETAVCGLSTHWCWILGPNAPDVLPPWKEATAFTLRKEGGWESRREHTLRRNKLHPSSGSTGLEKKNIHICYRIFLNPRSLSIKNHRHENNQILAPLQLRPAFSQYLCCLRYSRLCFTFPGPCHRDTTVWERPTRCTLLLNNLFQLTHCGRVTQICVFNTVKLGTSASSP